MRQPGRARDAGLTLVEILIGLALMAVVLSLVAPSVRNLIAAQRVRSINAELVTDLQYARSEAVRRNRPVYASFRSGIGSTCYSFSVDEICNCLLGPGRACTAPEREIKTVSVPRRVDVTLVSSGPITFDAVTGQASPVDVTVTSAVRGALRTTINATGRPSVCSPGGAFREVPPCP